MRKIKSFLSLVISANMFMLAAHSAAIINKQDAKDLSLTVGKARLQMISHTTFALQSPKVANPTGPVADSQSTSMYTTLAALTASEFASNEAVSTRNQFTMSPKCAALNSGQFKDDIPLYSTSCNIESSVNRLTALFQESDSLSQQTIEMEAALNQALAENVKRDEAIAVEKQAMVEINASMTRSLDSLKSAKDAQVIASANVAKAEAALAAANGIACVEICSSGADGSSSCSQDCSARDAAVAAAQAALTAAQAVLAQAVAALEIAVQNVVNLLINKMGVETKAVLALLSGTIQGETGKENVHFTVLGTDFPLINLGKTISAYTGVNATTASSFIDPKGVDKSTVNYFDDVVKNYANSMSSAKGPSASTDLSIKASNEVLDQISKTSMGGATDLATIAFAITNYKNDSSNKLLNYLESMKTPQSRITTMTQDIDAKNALKKNINVMIEHNIAFMDESLKLFKALYKEKNRWNSAVDGLLFPYLNDHFSSDPFKQKLAEGYFSKIDIDAIRIKYQSLVADAPDKGSTPSSGLYNFVAGDKASCEKSVLTKFPGSIASCSIGGGCGMSCGVPTGSCQSANPTQWGVCLDSKASVAVTASPAPSTPSSGLYNFVAGDKVTCENSILTRFPGTSIACSVGGGCGMSCGMPNAACPSANPTHWGACVDPANSVPVAPAPSAASLANLYGFVAGSKAACESSAAIKFPGNSITCSIGGQCGVSCGMPTAQCASLNPNAWGACVDTTKLSSAP